LSFVTSAKQKSGILKLFLSSIILNSISTNAKLFKSSKKRGKWCQVYFLLSISLFLTLSFYLSGFRARYANQGSLTNDLPYQGTKNPCQVSDISSPTFGGLASLLWATTRKTRMVALKPHSSYLTILPSATQPIDPKGVPTDDAGYFDCQPLIGSPLASISPIETVMLAKRTVLPIPRLRNSSKLIDSMDTSLFTHKSQSSVLIRY